MKLIEIEHQEVRPETGHCYVVELNGCAYRGEGGASLARSSLVLFEDGIQLGPSSSVHDEVRRHGSGAYSHWGNQVYFSASDNTNPKTNGKRYQLVLPENLVDESAQFSRLAASLATNSEFLKSVLAASLSTQGAELHSIYTLRILLMQCRLAGVSIDNASCLEIGASPTNGLAIALGLAGAKTVVLNNVGPIVEDIDIAFARNVGVLTGLLTPLRRTLEQVVDIATDGKTCRLKPEIYTVLGSVDAIRIAEYATGIDLMFSFSVLEHIRRLPEVMTSLRRAASNRCVGVHLVDVRDHTDFTNPLKFLYLDRTQFNAAYGEEHNRERLSDYIRIFHEAGWNVRSKGYIGSLPVSSNGGTDMYAVASLGAENVIQSNAAVLKRMITEPEIRKLDAEFRDYSAEELSILSFSVILDPQ